MTNKNNVITIDGVEYEADKMSEMPDLKLSIYSLLMKSCRDYRMS